MKKGLVILFFLPLFLIAFSAFQGRGLAAEWTFMVYLDGDNNLEGAGIDDLNEMETVGSTPEINVVVQFDRIEGYDPSNEDWSDTRRGEIIKDATIHVVTELISIGEKNMGDPETLREFITWGMTNFPANHYCLVLWNHGDGWYSRIAQFQQQLAMVNARIVREGPSLSLQQDATLLAKKIAAATKAICWDDTDGGDALTIKECREALEALNHPIDIIGFDACLMGMVEIAYEIKEVGSIMVASEELEPDDGWPYDLILADLLASPSMSPTQLSRNVVSHYGESYGGDETQSAILLSKISALSEKIDTLSSTLLSETTDWETIEQARDAASSFFEPDFRDLQGFLDGLLASVDNATIKNAVTQTKVAFREAVIENYSGSDEGAHGLSIHLIGLGGAFPVDYNATTLRFAEATEWDTFLTTLSQIQIPDDPYEDNDTVEDALPLSLGEFPSLRCNDDEWFKVSLPSGTPILATIKFSHSAGDLDMELYDSMLTLIDKSDSIKDTEGVYSKAEAPEDYYIHIYGYNGATNRYDLSLLSPAPDNYYTYEAIPYQWVDATDGTYLEMGDDDYTSIEIGFEFQFYGISYSGVKVSSNGYLTFGYIGEEYSNQPLPLPGEPSNLIAPFWDDLTPSSGNGVYYKVIGNAPNRKLVVEWNNVPHYYTFRDGITFEVILYEQTREIVFQYQDVYFNDPDYDYGQSATVGIENSPGTMGTLHSYKQASLSGGLALRFYPQKINANITEISLASGGFLPLQPIQFTTTATNRGNLLFYQYWIATGYGTPEYGAAWNMLRDYFPDDACTWSPTAEDRFVAIVYVTENPDVTTTTSVFAGMSIPVGTLSDRPHITRLKADISYPQPATEAITFLAEATGGSTPYYFQFWVSRTDESAKSWRIIQDFSPSATCHWTPGKAGSYVVVVYVSETPFLEETFPELAGMTLVAE